MVYGTDDTAAINSAVSAATTWAQANGYAPVDIIIPPLIYMLAGATTKTSTNKGNSQIPLPVIAATSPKLTIRFTSGTDASAPPMFGSGTLPQVGGAVFVSTLSLSVDATWGAPSIIGGPTSQQGYGTNGGSPQFANLLAVIDGLTFITSIQPAIIPVNLYGCATMSVPNATFLAFDTVTNLAAVYPVTGGFTNTWVNSLIAPAPLNNDNSYIGTLTTYGFPQGPGLFAHCAAHTIKSINCRVGLFIGSNGYDQHGVSILYCSLEECQTALGTDGSGSGIGTAVFIGQLDCESVGWYGSVEPSFEHHIYDPQNSLSGTVYVNDNNGTSVIKVDGATQIEIIAAMQARSNVTPPAVPATTVALQNPFWRHATVYITSGGAAVSVIAVNGTTTGLTLGTSGTVMVRVPSGATITLTYASTAPTWVWVLD